MTGNDACSSVRLSVRRRAGFTLVELLVVIGIIGVLLSLLLPAMSAARHSANALTCATNLRTIGQTMIEYAAENYNAIIGSPVNTGGGASVAAQGPGAAWPPGYTNTNFPPGVNAIWDWQTPVLTELGIPIPYSAATMAQPVSYRYTSSLARWDRVNFELSYQLFTCPEQNALATFAGGAGPNFFPNVQNLPGFLPVPSYTVGIDFMVIHNSGQLTAGNPGATPTVFGNFYENPPSTYAPRINLVGNAAHKIFCADGGRYVYLDSTPPIEYWNATDGEGGEYADWGADSAYTRAQNREHAPGNGGKQNVPDDRVLWARHGPVLHGNVANAFKFNAVFFDDHVEALGDLEGANPVYWMPKGTVVSPSEFWTDVDNYYGINPSQFFTCPE